MSFFYMLTPEEVTMLDSLKLAVAIIMGANSTFLLTILILQTLKRMKDTKQPTWSTPRMTIVNSGSALAAKFPNRNRRRLLGSFDDTKTHPYDTL